MPIDLVEVRTTPLLISEIVSSTTMPGLQDQTRYLTLRQRLTSLGYKSAVFSSDSMDIVEHLLNDLTNTAEAYETLQMKDQRLINDLSLAQSQLFPLRKENARLARENYEVFILLRILICLIKHRHEWN